MRIIPFSNVSVLCLKVHNQLLRLGFAVKRNRKEACVMSLVSVISSAFVDTCYLQDQRGGHSGLRAGCGHKDHPLHVLHQHADELHGELCRCWLQGPPCVKGEVKTLRHFAPSQNQRVTFCYRPSGDSLHFPA